MIKRFFVLAGLLFFTGVLFGQVGKGILEEKEQELIERPIPILRPGEVALEQEIDPETYLLGPGDKISINLWGEMEAAYVLTVTPEGKLLIPTVKDVHVGKLSLTEAKDKITKKIMKRYKNVEVTISLIELRKFRVAVVGAVQDPGVYVATAVDRVSEIIARAGGFLEENPSVTPTGTLRPRDEYEVISSKRNIELKRRDGDLYKVDVLRFYRTGERETNPRLHDGDLICVPAQNMGIGQVGIYGAVKIPGLYEFIQEDRLSDIINIAGGLTIDAKISEANIVRFNPDYKTTRSITINLRKLLVDHDLSRDVKLEADDRIFIRSIPDYHEKKQVSIEGEVLYPGIYSIEEEVTKLTDIIKTAGGFTEDAALTDAKLIRSAVEEIVDPEFERLKKMTVEEMNEMEYEYFKTKSREMKGVFAVDFVKLIEETDLTYNVLLRDEDRIVVPPKNKTVNVSGQVSRPGLVVYKPGENYLYYIEKAGGLSWNARKRKTRVIKGKTGEWIKPNKNTIIEVGDTIFIPEKPERDYWGLFKDAMAISAQIATVLIVVNSVR